MDKNVILHTYEVDNESNFLSLTAIQRQIEEETIKLPIEVFNAFFARQIHDGKRVVSEGEFAQLTQWH